MKFHALLLAFLFTATANASGQADLPQNGVLRHLIVEGVPLGADRTEPLKPPTLADGLDRDKQRRIVTRVAGRHGWSRFTRDSVVAPIALQLHSLNDARGNRIGHSIDLGFVAHGNLETFSEERLFKDFIQSETKKKASEGNGVALDAAELARNGIVVRETDGPREKFFHGEFPLLGRVRVAGTCHVAYARAERSLLVAWELDERFAADDPLRGRWQPIESDNLGRKKLGPVRAYRGYGGYGKITRLAEPEGALFIECHIVFHEPQEWFTGGNLLRAKMPLLTQESVRKFRRRLKKAEEARVKH